MRMLFLAYTGSGVELVGGGQEGGEESLGDAGAAHGWDVHHRRTSAPS